MKKWRYANNGISIIILFLMAFSCAAENIIRIGSNSRTLMLDPIKSVAAGDIETFGVLYSRLFRRDKRGQIAPGLAKSWIYSDDRTQLTLQLREAYFSNGKPILAPDVVFSIKRFRDHEASVLGSVISKVTDVIAVDDRTVQITLSAAFSPLIADLELVYAGIVSMEDITHRGEDEAFSTIPVSSGPYRVVNWKVNDRLIVEANPHYWREGYPKNDGAELIEVLNDNTRISKLLAGELDVVRDVPWPKVAVLRDLDNINVALEEAIRINVITLNHGRPPFNDLRVRQAAALALDRKAISHVMTVSNAPVANTVFPSSLQYHDKDYPGWPYDPVGARQLLKDAGMIGSEITILIRASRQDEKIAVVMQAQWLAIGLKAKIEKVDSALWWEFLATGNYDAVPAWWMNENSEPDGAVNFALCGDCGSHAYYSYFQNEEVNQLNKQGTSLKDGAERRDLYLKLQKIATEQVSQIPLYYAPWRNAYSSAIRGLKMTPALQWTLEEAEVVGLDAKKRIVP